MSVEIESYEQALQFVYGRIDYERLQGRDYSADDLKLDRMRKLLGALGDPQTRIPTLHVAGTKGKGSTCEMIASIMSASQRQVGLYTSPHVSRFEERMRVNGHPPSRSEFVQLVKQFTACFSDDAASLLIEEATFFEIGTALAWLHFSNQKVDVVVLEVGLGGRLDCTNICQPKLTVITKIALDHTQVLGDTIAEIAAEKAGIIKQGIPVISTTQQQDAERVITRTASKFSAPLVQLGKQLTYEKSVQKELDESETQGEMKVSLNDVCVEELTIPLIGEHQLENATLAVGAALLLNETASIEPKLSPDQIRNGIKSVILPLRMEVFSRLPPVLLDAAHNVAAVEAFISTLQVTYPHRRKTLIFGSSMDKDVAGMVTLLKQDFDAVVATEYQTNPRSVGADDIYTLFSNSPINGDLFCEPNPADALKLAREITDEDAIICVTGSFFLAAEIREILLSEMDT